MGQIQSMSPHPKGAITRVLQATFVNPTLQQGRQAFTLPLPPKWVTALRRAADLCQQWALLSQQDTGSCITPSQRLLSCLHPLIPLEEPPHLDTPIPPWHSQEEDDAGVGHGIGQPQDAAAHDGIAQIEDGHPE